MGIGIGGARTSPWRSQGGVLRDINLRHSEPEIAKLETELIGVLNDIA